MDLDNILSAERIDGTLIYGLVDPREPEVVRYVGQTQRPALRLREHIERKNRSRDDKEGWLDMLDACGVTLQMIALDVLPAGAPKYQVAHYEAAWTYYYGHECGLSLVGGGNSGPIVMTLACAEWNRREREEGRDNAAA